MDRKRRTYFAVGFGVLLLVVVMLLVRGSRREPAGIVLPDNLPDTEESGIGHLENHLNVVEISPETVKPAINTLSRPASYSRTQTAETFWSGGSGQSVSQVSVSGGKTRIDTRLTGGGVRHTLITNENESDSAAYVWYDDEKNWTVLRGGQFNADLAGRMPTYESVRDLPVDAIAAADYRMKDRDYCIYVETAEDTAGYADRYWVSTATGLLNMAERVCNGEVVYRFSAAAPDVGAPEERVFLLPDGSRPGAE